MAITFDLRLSTRP